HPLWESAVAMWNEMSPERALFAPGAPDESPAAAAGAGGAFVDITGDTSPGAALGATAGGEGVLETTQVGLTNERSVDSGLDFDLGGGDEVFDLTAAGPGGTNEVIDLTASTDLDSALGEATDFGEIFDISA